MAAEKQMAQTDIPTSASRRKAQSSPPDAIPEDEAYFWTEAWQELERQADEDFQNGDSIKGKNWADVLRQMSDKARGE